MNQTKCELDPCSTKPVYKYMYVHKGTLAKMVILSLEQSLFIQAWKLATIKPLMKNINLGTKLKNYRPTCNLSFVSKNSRKGNSKSVNRSF